MPRKRTPEEKAWNTGFGARVEKARKTLGLSQGQLGERLPWVESPQDGQQTVSKYERGLSTPSAFRLAVLARTLKLPASDLLNDIHASEVTDTGADFISIVSELTQILNRLDISAQHKVLTFAQSVAANV